MVGSDSGFEANCCRCRRTCFTTSKCCGHKCSRRMSSCSRRMSSCSRRMSSCSRRMSSCSKKTSSCSRRMSSCSKKTSSCNKRNVWRKRSGSGPKHWQRNSKSYGSKELRPSAGTDVANFSSSCRRRLEQRLHVLLVRLDAGLTVGIDAHQAALDDRGEHQHLHELPHRVLRNQRQDEVGRRSRHIVVRLVGAAPPRGT